MRALDESGRRPAPATLAAYGALAVPFLVSGLRVLFEKPQHLFLHGDQALIEIAARSASHGDQLLGPYSRFGYHHPGPLMFYVYGIVLRVFGYNPKAVYFAAIAVNAVCALVVVWVFRRRFGATAGLVASAIVTVFALGGFHDLYRDTWNPYVIVLPMLALVVLCADFAAGAWWALPGTAALASWEVQDHLGTTVAVGGLVALALAVRLAPPLLRRTPLLRHRLGAGPSGADGRAWLRPSLVTVGVVGLLWLAPVVEQLTDDPGNMRRLFNFFRGEHGDHTYGQANELLGRALDGPVTRYRSLLANQGGLPHELVPALLALVLVGAIVAGWRSGVFGRALAGLALVALVASLVSLTRVAGELLVYLAAWMSAITPAVALAVVAVVAERRPTLARTQARLGTGLAYAAALVPGVVLLGNAIGAPSVQHAVNRRDVSALWTVIDPALTKADKPVLLRVSPVAAAQGTGVFLELEREGHDPKIEPAQAELYGPDFQGNGQEPAQLALLPDGADPSGLPAGSKVIGSAAGITVYLERGANS